MIEHASGRAFALALWLVALMTACGSSTQTHPAGATDVSTSQPAPEFRVETFDGSKFALSEHRGMPVVLNFWESW